MDNLNNKILLIIRGTSGCGKSSLGSIVADKFFETDKFFEREDGYEFDFKELDEAQKWCKYGVENAMKEGVPKIAVTNNSSTHTQTLPYRKLAERYGYHAYSIVLENTGTTSKHVFNTKTIEKQEKLLLKNLTLAGGTSNET